MPNNQISIKFAAELVPLVKNGAKTLTYRLGNKFDFLSEGDRVNVADDEGIVFAKVRILEKTRTAFKYLPFDRSGHETYKSTKDMAEVFERYYGRKIDPQESVIVLKYELVGNIKCER